MLNRRLYFGDLKRKMLRKKLLICAIYEDSLPLLIIIPIILRVALVRLLNHIQQRRHPHPSGTNAAPPPTDRPQNVFEWRIQQSAAKAFVLFLI